LLAEECRELGLHGIQNKQMDKRLRVAGRLLFSREGRPREQKEETEPLKGDRHVFCRSFLWRGAEPRRQRGGIGKGGRSESNKKEGEKV